MMRNPKDEKAQTFPVLDGSSPAPREDQIAGIVEKVWADSTVYHEDVEKLLRSWLTIEGCVVRDDEFAVLLARARGEFGRRATATDPDAAPSCPPGTIIDCLYSDVERLERNRSRGINP